MSAPTSTRAAVETPALDLDARLALVGAAMQAALDEAAVAFEVNTAHIAATPSAEITRPEAIPAAMPPAPSPYSTPLARLLHRAYARLEAGWCTGRLEDESGAVCLIGAIRAEAHSTGHIADACAVLLEVIRRDFPNVETVPSWNDSQRGPRLPLRYLQRAADLANARWL